MVSAAAAMSGRGPMVTAKTIAAAMMAKTSAASSTRPMAGLGRPASALSALMRPSVSIQLRPNVLAMRPSRDAAQPAPPSRSCRGLRRSRRSSGLRPKSPTTTERWPGASSIQRPADLAVADACRAPARRVFRRYRRSRLRCGGRACGRRRSACSARSRKATAAPARRPPGVPFQMDGQQRFLHDILRIDTALPGPAPRKAAHEPGGAMKKAA